MSAAQTGAYRAQTPVVGDEVQQSFIVKSAAIQRVSRAELLELGVLTLADVEPRSVEWLWESYLPRAEPVILAGDGGVGKSYLALEISAAVTRGRPLPLGSRTPPADVLYVTDEDDIEATIKPRVNQLDADQTRFHTMDLADGSASSWFRCALDAALELRAALIVIDPIQSFVGPGKDMNKVADMRQFMQKMRLLAQRTGATVLIIAHTNKGTGAKAQYRVSGSTDIVNASRSTLIAGRVEVDGEEMCVMAHVKSNYAAKGPTLRYEISESGFSWQGPVVVTAEDISSGKREASKITLAAQFLLELLSKGSCPQSAVYRQALARGISAATLRRAQRLLCIPSKKCGNHWVWALPETQGAQHDHESETEHLEMSQTQISDKQPEINGINEHLEDAEHHQVERVTLPNGEMGIKL